METVPDRRRPLRFVAVGAWNTVFGYLAFAVFWRAATALELSYLMATVPAHLFAVLNAYLCHRYLVFGTERRVSSSLPRFLLVQAVSFALAVGLLAALVSCLGLHPLVGQGVVLATIAVLSYGAHSRFSFA